MHVHVCMACILLLLFSISFCSLREKLRAKLVAVKRRECGRVQYFLNTTACFSLEKIFTSFCSLSLSRFHSSFSHARDTQCTKSTYTLSFSSRVTNLCENNNDSNDMCTHKGLIKDSGVDSSAYTDSRHLSHTHACREN